MKTQLLIASLAAMACQFSHGFDSAPHVLVLPGHTNSLSQGPNGEVLVTCDYKTLDGGAPKPGEPCTGEPTLAISVEDLKNLRYISEANDNNELVRRVYEKYDDIVFIVSPDFEIPMAPQYSLDVSPVSIRHPEVPESIYLAYSKVARDMLRSGTGYRGDYMLGVTIAPYGYSPAFDEIGEINPLENMWRPLADYTLVFLPANPSKSTLIHEFLHFLFQSARQKAVVSPKRLEEFRKNRGFGEFLQFNVLNESPTILLEESRRAAYELSNVITLLENVDDSIPEEIEVNYFISRYRVELGLIAAADDHKRHFWQFADYFMTEIEFLNSLIDNRYALPYYTQAYIRENAPLWVGGQPRRNYFRNVWANIRTLARAYPKDLIGVESDPKPGTMMHQFIQDVGPRAETAR